MDERADILISRIVDGVASAADTAELEALAASRPTIWRDLAMAQRDQALLSQEMARAIAVAEVVGLPTHIETHRESLAPASRWKRAGVWGGWAAAAVMALAYVGAPMNSSTQQASLIPSMNVLKDGLTADQAWEVYEAAGNREQRLIGVLPERVLIEATPSADGKTVRMVFLRQLIETKTVDALFKETIDETGKGCIVPADLPKVLNTVPMPETPVRRTLPPV